MTGTFEYGKGDKRAGAGLQRVLPLLRELPVLLRRRLVPHADAPLGPDRRRQAGRLVRRDGEERLPPGRLPRRPPKLLVAEGKAKKADFPFGQRRLSRADARSSSTASNTTARKPNDYIAKLPIGLKGNRGRGQHVVGG